MERLTAKYNDAEDGIIYDLAPHNFSDDLSMHNAECEVAINRVIDKLGQLEDIEEELGIELKVYHKLMSMLYCGDENKLYVKDKNAIIQVGILEIDYCKKKILFYKDKNYNDDYVYGFGQYGKAWALTKEELE